MTGALYDCPPTLDDDEVIEFCKNGYILIEAAVPDDINQRVLDYTDEYPEANLTQMLELEWFSDAVIKNPQAAGALRSLLGKNFKLPHYMNNHRTQCPRPGKGGWHRDGGAIEALGLDSLQVFYYPQNTPVEMGPTEIVPCSHFVRTKRRYMAHYGSIRQGVSTAAPAGSIFITHYSVWHRATRSTASGIRNMLKYNYFRTAAPQRDWRADPNFNLSSIDLRTQNGMPEKWYDAVRVARLFLWLCGREEFDFKGGQTWPVASGQRFGVSEGMPQLDPPA